MLASFLLLTVCGGALGALLSAHRGDRRRRAGRQRRKWSKRREWEQRQRQPFDRRGGRRSDLTGVPRVVRGVDPHAARRVPPRICSDCAQRRVRCGDLERDGRPRRAARLRRGRCVGGAGAVPRGCGRQGAAAAAA
eukprot:64752-Chlamydomonas_euryale.AAC.2